MSRPKRRAPARKPRPVGKPKEKIVAAVPAGTSLRSKLRRAISTSKGSLRAASRNLVRELYPNARELSIPELPPGVIPAAMPTGDNLTLAMDSGVQEIARDAMPGVERFFSWGNEGMAFGYFFQGYPYYAQLTQISEYRNPCERLATEMTRKWIKLKATDNKKKPGETEKPGDDTQANDALPAPPTDGEEAPADDGKQALADKIIEITQQLEDWDVRGVFRQAVIHDGWFGMGPIFIRIKGQEGDNARQLPLTIGPDSIGKGDVLGFSNIEPYWLTPYSYNAVDPTRPDFYKPISWFSLGKKTHASRFFMLCARPVPDLLKPAYNFGGQPLIALLEPAVNMWLRTRKSVNDLIHNFSVTILKSNLATLLQEDEAGDEEGGLLNRAQLMTTMRDNQAVAVIDMTSEDIVKADTSLAGLDKLQAQAQEHMAAICNEPLVIMTGVTPSGLNASSEGEIQVWHENVGAQQKNVIDRPLKQVIELAQLNLYGEIDDAITHEWVPLDEPTAKELAEERKSDADRDGVYIDKGVLDPQEVRDKLSKDPTSGYDGLTGDAPGPPIDPNANPEDDAAGDDEDAAPDADADAGREHESSEADKDREHQSSEADKDRKHQLKLAAKKTPKK